MTIWEQVTTAGALGQMPEDGFRYELVRGELRKMVPAGNEHGRIAAVLTVSLGQHVLATDSGVVYAAETGFKIADEPDTVRAPDVAFVLQERLDAIGDIEGYWPGAPDLVVEVISPNDVYAEVEEKVADWLDAGSRMVVVVNPRQREVKVHRSQSDIAVLTERDILEGGDVVPGWAFKVADLFA